MATMGLLPVGQSKIDEQSKIIFEGKDLLSLSRTEMRKICGKDIAMIFQEPMSSLNPVFTVGNQIAEVLCLHMGLSRKQARQRVLELLKEVGIPSPETKIDAYPNQLSGGQQQRVMIAMAIACEPKLLIADEPTTALDSTVQRQVMELFKDINKELGISIMLISHDLGLVKHYSNSLAVMYAGQIVESGRAEEVFKNPKHPYTQLLIKIIPSFKIKKNEPLAEIPGYVRETGRDAAGCLFINRCPYAMDVCAESVEEHRESNSHYYRCNLK
ncbi:MAG TPA: hypothetical protein DCM73_09960 [Clostridiales bacterium]|nr:hypothetical protein [Clostridiales bacterium]